MGTVTAGEGTAAADQHDPQGWNTVVLRPAGPARGWGRRRFRALLDAAAGMADLLVVDLAETSVLDTHTCRRLQAAAQVLAGRGSVLLVVGAQQGDAGLLAAHAPAAVTLQLTPGQSERPLADAVRRHRGWLG